MITIKFKIVVVFGGREGTVFGIEPLEELLGWLVFQPGWWLRGYYLYNSLKSTFVWFSVSSF